LSPRISEQVEQLTYTAEKRPWPLKNTLYANYLTECPDRSSNESWRSLAIANRTLFWTLWLHFKTLPSHIDAFPAQLAAPQAGMIQDQYCHGPEEYRTFSYKLAINRRKSIGTLIFHGMEDKKGDPECHVLVTREPSVITSKPANEPIRD
jgi:hypothetical protein